MQKLVQKLKKLLVESLFAFAFCFSNLDTIAQSQVKLSIGDDAPSIKFSKWLKGSPVDITKHDQLYILEFWATWCGPCKAAMPHLSKLQEEYEGKAKFIGVGVWERVEKGKPYETSLPAVTEFMAGYGTNMKYDVIADNNEEYMGNKWLKAAGIPGIPATFIIKKGQIIWLGHPLALDTILPKIIDGSYDMQAFKVAYEEKALESKNQIETMRATFATIDKAMNEKDYDKAIELIEKAQQEQPRLKVALDAMKFTALLKVSSKKAKAFAEEWKKENNTAPSMILVSVNREGSLPKKTYLWAAKNYESSNPTPGPLDEHLLATTYSKAGDYKNAIVHEEKAVLSAKKALKESKMVGLIFDQTVTDFETALAGYRNLLNSSKKS